MLWTSPLPLNSLRSYWHYLQESIALSGCQNQVLTQNVHSKIQWAPLIPGLATKLVRSYLQEVPRSQKILGSPKADTGLLILSHNVSQGGTNADPRTRWRMMWWDSNLVGKINCFGKIDDGPTPDTGEFLGIKQFWLSLSLLAFQLSLKKNAYNRQ